MRNKDLSSFDKLILIGWKAFLGVSEANIIIKI